MPRLSPIRGKDLIRFLEKLGFKFLRQEGSHARLIHADGRKTTVPLHSGEEIRRGLLRKILRDVHLSPDDFEKLRHK